MTAAAAQTGQTTIAAPAYPAYMGELVDRAAAMLKARWPATVVEFTWWADKRGTAYFARMEWPGAMLAPRVQVFDASSGDFVCQSLEGHPFDIDPATWCLDAAPDEVARYAWEESRRGRAA